MRALFGPEASERMGLPGIELTWDAVEGERLYGPAGASGLDRYGQRIETWADAQGAAARV